MTNLLQVKTSASALVDTLLELKVDSIFGYPGASVLSIYNELSKVSDKIKHYLVRHEQAAVHAAEGYARVSGKTGVVLVTSGPGFTNTVTGIANAYADSTPLVILAGEVTNVNHSDKVFQKVDIKAIAKPCSKKVLTLSANDDISALIKEAFKEAESGVKGPVVVVLPRNVLETSVKYTESTLTEPEILQQDTKEYVDKFISLVNSAKHPLFLVGGGCIDAAQEFEQLASILQIPIVSTLMGIGIYPSENNLYLGMIGINGVDSANEALMQCDLLIALGAAFSDRSTCKKNDFAKNCKVISVNLKPSKKDYELQIISDVKEFLQECLKLKHKFRIQTKWRMEADIFKDEAIAQEDPPHCLHSSFVLETLSEYTKYYEPIVVTDVGQHQMLTAQFFNFNKPRKFITSGGLGTMGFGLPAAIGAHIANPANLILNITGDGSFQMNLQELATCREHHIPVKIIIMNNSYLGMVRELQEKIYQTRYQVEMINPDFTKIAEAYDLYAVRVKNKSELIPALEKAIKHPGTAIVDIVIHSFENI